MFHKKLTNDLQTQLKWRCYKVLMNLFLKTSLQFFAILIFAFFALGAFAQGAAPKKFYLGIGVGPIIPQSVSSNLAGTIAGNGSVQFNASGFVGLVVGYRFIEHFGIEGEGGWTLYDSHDLVGAFSRSGTPLPGDIPLNGDMHTWLSMANLVYRPRGEDARLAPYFGAGIGVAGLEWLVDSRPGGSVILSLRGGSTSVSADVMAGLDYSVTRRFLLGGRYNFVHVARDIPAISGGAMTLTHSTPEIHLLQMVGTYRF
jgi:opacity protein-like surface antigen